MSETDQALTAISRLPKLEKLAINNSRGITDAGLAPSSELKSLRHLDLLNCWPVHGTGLVQLAGLRLTYLAVTLTSCSDQVLADLPHTTALRKLGFTDCPAVTDLSALSSISVQSLSFVGCGINDATVAGLSECKSLRKLELYACENITDACLETLHGLRPLRMLEITRCNQITANRLQTLRQQRPELTIRYEVDERAF